MSSTWEDMISLNSQEIVNNVALDPAKSFSHLGLAGIDWNQRRYPLERALNVDSGPLPNLEQREGYYGDNHFAYWASGLRDLDQAHEWLEKSGKKISSLLEIGCATGRFLRHVCYQDQVPTIYGCDINRLHIDWICRNLPKNIQAFQNTSLPVLPLEANSVDFIAAFSVFTHIESFDTSWLMEFRRILRPGGIAWITIHGDRTWRDLSPDWPIYNAVATHPDMPDRSAALEIPSDRFVLRWRTDMSYTANVYYRYDYIRAVWGRFLEVADIFSAKPHYQDVVVLVK